MVSVSNSHQYSYAIHIVTIVMSQKLETRKWYTVLFMENMISSYLRVMASRKRGVTMRCHSTCILSHFRPVQLFVTTWTVGCQTSLSMGFSRQEYWNGLPCPPPGDLPDPGIEPAPLMSVALAEKFFTTSTTWEAPMRCHPTVLQILSIHHQLVMT